MPMLNGNLRHTLDDISEARLRVLWVQNNSKSTEPRNGDSAKSAETEAAGEESQQDEGEEEEPEVDLYAGFDEEPFVRAAAQFRAENYHGILELLTEAVEQGE